MAETPGLGLPLLEGGQAQKHVTVNEALTRLDALVQMRVLSRSASSPPLTPLDGDRYIVGSGATEDWLGAEENIAMFVNGGWDLIAPSIGWRAFIDDEQATAVFDGAAWRADALTTRSIGAATRAEIVWLDHTILPGPISDTASVIPDRGIVLGVTGRVISEIGGASSWRLGVAGAEDRYGSGLGVAMNSEAVGPTGTPVTYYGDTALRLSADGADFAGGTVRLAIHFLTIEPPSLV